MARKKEEEETRIEALYLCAKCGTDLRHADIFLPPIPFLPITYVYAA